MIPRLPGVPSWLFIAAGVLVIDFLDWLAHLGNHRVNSLWRLHAVHHSQEELSILTTFRAHPLVHVSFLLTAVPILAISSNAVTPAVIFTIYACLGALPHANVPWTYGPAGRVLISPAYHRIHHQATGRLDINLGTAFAIWDALSRRAVFPAPGAARLRDRAERPADPGGAGRVRRSRPGPDVPDPVDRALHGHQKGAEPMTATTTQKAAVPGKAALWALIVIDAGLLVASGAIHLDLWNIAYRHVNVLGPLFLLQVISAFVIAAGLLVTRHILVVLAALGLVLGTILGFILVLHGRAVRLQADLHLRPSLDDAHRRDRGRRDAGRDGPAPAAPPARGALTDRAAGAGRCGRRGEGLAARPARAAPGLRAAAWPSWSRRRCARAAVTIVVRLAGDRSPAALPAQDRPGPVLLVPGYGGSTDVAVRCWPPDRRDRPDGDRAQPARQRHRQPDPGRRRAQRGRHPRCCAAGAPSVDVIGYSAGGVDRAAVGAGGRRRPQGPAGGHARLAVPRDARRGRGGRVRARRLPGGLPAAGAGQQPARRAGRRRARAAALAVAVDDRRHRPSRRRTRPGWPARSTCPIQSVCPRQRISHSQLPTSPVVTAMVLRAIGAGPIARPGAARLPGLTRRPQRVSS